MRMQHGGRDENRTHVKGPEVRPAGLLVEVLGDLLPGGEPVVAHVLPGLVVVPPAAGVEGLLNLHGIEEGNHE